LELTRLSPGRGIEGRHRHRPELFSGFSVVGGEIDERSGFVKFPGEEDAGPGKMSSNEDLDIKRTFVLLL
jgi:hypothetical protein